MKHRGQAELPAEVRPAELQQGLGHGPEEEVTDDSLVAQGERVELVRQGEDQMKVGDRQELGLPLLKPPGFGQRLAFRAMTIPAGVIGRAPEAAGVALLEVNRRVRRSGRLRRRA